MTDPAVPLHHQWAETLARHLPPSGAVLRLVDVGGRASALLCELRPDITVIATPEAVQAWSVDADSADAVVALGESLHVALLTSALAALRPGGRLIIFNPKDRPGKTQVKTLEKAGFTRILVEAGLTVPVPSGALLRGEKPHTEVRTVDRVKQVTAQEANPRAARFVYLLIEQQPFKPAWRMKPDEPRQWKAAGVKGDGETVVLAFSSLPRAVEFMQPVVMAGHIQSVNKIGKFAWELTKKWPFPIMLNPSDELFDTQTLAWTIIDPDEAEAPDE
jgi:hypothetical protein